MSLPRVRYVVPSFNQGRYLRETLESALRQDHPALEVVVLDGASTDETLDVLRSIHDPRLRWVSEPDRGQVDAIQKGLALDGPPFEFFNWLGSDDLLAGPTVTSTLVARAQETGADVVYGEGEFIDQGGRPLGRYRTGPATPAALREEGSTICQPSALIRVDALRRVGGLDSALHSVLDYDLWLRLADAGARFERVADVTSCYRLHGESKTSAGRVRAHTELFRLFAARGERVSVTLFDGAFRECVLLPARGEYEFPQDVGRRLPWTLLYRALRLSTRSSRLQGLLPALFREPAPGEFERVFRDRLR